MGIRDLRLSLKFGYTFATVCLLTAILGVSSLFSLLRLSSSLKNVVDKSTPALSALASTRYAFSSIRRTDALLMLCNDPDCFRTNFPLRADAVKTFNEALSQYAKLVSYPGEKQIYESIRDNGAAYVNVAARARELDIHGEPDASYNLMTKGDGPLYYDKTVASLAQALALNKGMAQQIGAAAIDQAHKEMVAMCILVVVTVAMCAFVGLGLTRLIVPPLKAAVEALDRVAAKDLTSTFEAQGRDELGHLLTTVNLTVASIRELVQSVAENAKSLAEKAQDVSAHASLTSGNTQSQTNAMIGVSTEVQHMTATIDKISSSAVSATEASQNSARSASQSGEVLQAAAATMERIETATATVEEKMNSLTQRSQEIGKVVQVIQEISEQTNLLALNAAIEAARAGEHGRGFAVVAGEVRRLAERTKSATEEIGASIQTIQLETRQTFDLMAASRSAVQTGLQETSNALDSMNSIIQSSRKLEELIAEISISAAEQFKSSKGILESSHQISSLALENDKSSGDTVIVSMDLLAMATYLEGMIAEFHVGAHGGELSQRG